MSRPGPDWRESLPVLHATDPALRAYGAVVKLPAAAAPIETEELRYWPTLAPLELESGWGEVGLCQAVRRPGRVVRMERHVRTSEFVAPIDGPMVVPIGLRTPTPAPGPGLCAVRLSPGEGLMLHPAVWHWAGYPAGARVTFWVVFRRLTAAEDLEIRDLARAHWIEGLDA